MVVAGVIALAAMLFRLEPTALSVPLDLRAGAVQVVEFRTRYAKPYQIGVEMDQKAAQRIVPCMADARSPSFGRCKPGELPLALSLALIVKGSDAPTVIRGEGSKGGGSATRDETYSMGLGATWLRGGETYQLTIRSLSDATILAPAHPRLIVELDSFVITSDGITRGVLMLAAMALGVIGAILALGVLVIR